MQHLSWHDLEHRNGALQVAAVHVIPERQYQKSFTYNIVKITGTRPGQTPVLQFSVTNPTNSNKPWSRCRMSGKRISRRITR